jgi:hypothetical protein
MSLIIAFIVRYEWSKTPSLFKDETVYIVIKGEIVYI